MGKYGKIERKFALLLEKIPFIKKIAKRAYTSLNYCIFRSKEKAIIKNNYQYEIVSPANDETFFGYYDRSPVNKEGKVVFFHIPPKANPYKCDRIDIIYNNKIISSTTSWNYQQGALMCWIDNKSIIHNIFDNGQYKSKIINVESCKFDIVDFPVYSVHNDIALSLNFTRLAMYRKEYGYYNLPYSSVNFSDNEDGVFLIDLRKNTKRLLISIATLKNHKPVDSMKNAKHKVNHLQFSPDGKHFIFHHRWYDKNGVKYSRLYYSDVVSGNLLLLSDGGMVSHCNFQNDKNIIGWMRISGIDGYYLINTETLKVTMIGKTILREDGHPSFDDTGNLLLTDTYPDRSGMQQLYIYDLKNNLVVFNASFFSPLKYRGETRCDLHPRWDPDFAGITFDSTHTGNRQLYRIKGLRHG